MTRCTRSHWRQNPEDVITLRSFAFIVVLDAFIVLFEVRMGTQGPGKIELVLTPMLQLFTDVFTDIFIFITFTRSISSSLNRIKTSLAFNSTSVVCSNCFILSSWVSANSNLLCRSRISFRVHQWPWRLPVWFLSRPLVSHFSGVLPASP